MAGPFPQADFVFELSTDGAAFTAYTAQSIQVTPGGGELARGSVNTAGRVAPYLTRGKKGIQSWTVRALYTTGGSELFPIVKGYYTNRTQIWMRWSPEGTASGSRRTEIGPGYIVSCPEPAGDANSGDPMAVEFSMEGEDEVTDTW